MMPHQNIFNSQMLFSLKSRHTLCSYQVVVSTLLTHHQRSFTWQRRKLFLFCLAETKRRLRAPLVSFEFFVQSGTYQTAMIYTIRDSQCEASSTEEILYTFKKGSIDTLRNGHGPARHSLPEGWSYYLYGFYSMWWRVISELDRRLFPYTAERILHPLRCKRDFPMSGVLQPKARTQNPM